MNADGSGKAQLTFGEIYGALPSFAPDGKSILFTGYATGNPELWLMGIDGANPHPITRTTGSGVGADGVTVRWSSHGSFSPDGAQIAYCSTQSGHAEIWVMKVDGSGQKQLTFPDDLNCPDAHNPTWSPDGDKIVFYRGFVRGHGHIFLMDRDGLSCKQLTSMYPSDDPSWSPDGQQIFYDIYRNGRTEAWIMLRDGSNQQQLSRTAIGPSCLPAITKFDTADIFNDMNTVQPTRRRFPRFYPFRLSRRVRRFIQLGTQLQQSKWPWVRRRP